MHTTYRYLVLLFLGIGAIIFSSSAMNVSYQSMLRVNKENGIMKTVPQNVKSPKCLITGCPAIATCSLSVSYSSGSFANGVYSITQADTLTMTVGISGNMPPIPTGNLTFYLKNAANIPYSDLGSVAQSIHAGVVVYAVKRLPIGELAYMIGYSGDSTYNSGCFVVGRADVVFWVNVSAAIPTPTPVIKVVPTATHTTNKPTSTPAPNVQTTPPPLGISQVTPTGTSLIAPTTTVAMLVPTPMPSQAKSGKQLSPNNLSILAFAFFILLCIGSSIAGLVIWRGHTK